jgi:hypothetical protein
MRTSQRGPLDPTGWKSRLDRGSQRDPSPRREQPFRCASRCRHVRSKPLRYRRYAPVVPFSAVHLWQETPPDLPPCGVFPVWCYQKNPALKSRPYVIRNSATNNPAPQNSASCLRISSRGDVAGNARKRTLAIAANRDLQSLQPKDGSGLEGIRFNESE